MINLNYINKKVKKIYKKYKLNKLINILLNFKVQI